MPRSSANRDFRFPKSSRLLKRREFRRTYDLGTPHRHAGFHLFVLPREGVGPSRIGITVTRSAGNAVERNTIRRRVREAFRHLRPELEPGYDVVVNCRRNLLELDQSEFSKRFRSLMKRAGLLRRKQ